MIRQQENTQKMIFHLNKEVFIQKIGHCFITTGLVQKTNREISVLKGRLADEEYLSLLKYIVDYILTAGPMIKNEETITYYSWVLKFIDNGECFELWEVSQDGNGFVAGVDYAIKVCTDQRIRCAAYETDPSFPGFNQKIVISEGVYDRLPTKGVRYPSPDHMTGWWLTTDLYNGDISSLMTVHFYHLAFTRPDLLGFLALPDGYRFYSDQYSNDIWFDITVLT